MKENSESLSENKGNSMNSNNEKKLEEENIINLGKINERKLSEMQRKISGNETSG